MKGIKYEVTYTESYMDSIHGYYYTTEVIHIPDLKAEINHKMIRKENSSYTKPINKVKPKKLGTIDISDQDAEKIKNVLKFRTVEKSLIKKITGVGEDD